MPFRVGVSIERIPTLDESSSNSINRLDWSRLSKSDIDSYTLLTDDILSRVHIPVVALNCKNVDCTDPSHVAEVNLFYENLIPSIKSADTEAFANVRNGRRDKAYDRPGWSDYVDELHQSAGECFLSWRDTGKPRQGQKFDLMQQSGARFKYAIRAIKQRENAPRREYLAKKMTSNSNCAFWKEIKKMNNVNTPLPNCIAGVSGGGNISELWREQFSELLNCISDTTDGGEEMGQDGGRRKTYSAAVIDGIKRNSTTYVGDSIVRKTDTRLNKGEDVVVCFPGARIEHVTERVERIMGRGKGGTILVHVGTNNADKEGTTAIVEKYRELLKKTKQARVGQIIISGILPVFGNRIDGYRNSKRMAINGMTKRLCEEEDVGYVDLWDSFVGIEELYARDGLHLSGKGAAAFAEGLSGAVASGLGKVRYLN